MKQEIIAKAIDHALEEAPRESVGLVAVVKGRERYVRCKNLAKTDDYFCLDPRDYAKTAETGEIVCIVHSHPTTNPEPSDADLVSCERSRLPWLIVNPVTGGHTLTEPSGYKQPLLGREWVWGVSDCWTLCRDWYIEQGLTVVDFDRPPTPEEFEQKPLFEESWQIAGFTEVPADQMQYGDLLLMNLQSPVDGLNHCGVCVEDGLLLHHVRKRLSSRDVYSQMLRNKTGRVLRHYDAEKLMA